MSFLPHYSEPPAVLQTADSYTCANLLAANVAEIIAVPYDSDGYLAKVVTFKATGDFYAKPMLGDNATELAVNGTFAEYVTNGAFGSDTGWTKGTGWSITGGKAVLASSHVAISTITQTSAIALVAARTYTVTYTVALTAHVTNGTFASDTGWTKGSGWVIAAGVATATLADTDLEQDCPETLVEGRTYTVTFTTSSTAAGSVAVSLGGGDPGTSRSTDNTFVEVITAGATNVVAFTGTGFTGSIDNVTITAVGTITPVIGGTAGTPVSTAATFTEALIADTTQAIAFTANADFVGTIDAVSVTAWGLGTGWTTDGSTAIATGAITTDLVQTIVAPQPALVSGGKYLVTFTATRAAGSVTVALGGGSAGTSRSSSATFSEIITAGSTQVITFAGTGFTGTIDNVSVTKCIAVPGDTTDGSAGDLNPPGYTLNRRCTAISIVSAGTPIVTSNFYK